MTNKTIKHEIKLQKSVIVILGILAIGVFAHSPSPAKVAAQNPRPMAIAAHTTTSLKKAKKETCLHKLIFITTLRKIKNMIYSLYYGGLAENTQKHDPLAPLFFRV